MVEETTSSFGDAKCFPVRAVSFREGKNEMCFVLTSLFHFFHDKKLPSSNTFGFLNHFILHLVLQWSPVPNRSSFLMQVSFYNEKNTPPFSKEKDYLVGSVFLYLSLLQNFWSRYTSTLLRPAPLSWKTKKTLRCSSRKPMVVFVFSVCNPKIWLSKEKLLDTNWYTKILHDFEDF